MAVVGAVVAVFSAYTAYSGAKKAENRANQAALDEQEMSRQEAANIEAETEESVRRAKDKAAKQEGENRARANASGVRTGVGGSLDIGLDAMTEEHDRQIEWMGKAGASKARYALAGGDMRAAGQLARGEQFNAQAWGAVGQGASNVYSSGQTSGWWG